MVQARYWRANVVGFWLTGAWAGEMAQTSVTGIAIDGGGDFSPVINEPLPYFEATPSGDFSEDANWSIYAGSIGPGNWSIQHQTGIADALFTFATATKAYQHTSFKWSEVRVAAIDNAGDYVNGATVFVRKTPVAGTAASIGSPAQSIVCSWRTGGRGPRNRGRSFVPTPGVGLGTDGLLGSTHKSTVGNAGRALHDALELIQGISHVVVSGTHKTYSTITGIQVGDEMDFQQRRRRERTEQYTSY